jgi:uncharacterized membrane protein YphA (DoxX/SURF4 family)
MKLYVAVPRHSAEVLPPNVRSSDCSEPRRSETFQRPAMTPFCRRNVFALGRMLPVRTPDVSEMERLPVWLGYLAAFTEFFGGLLLLVGLLTRIVAIMMAIEMVVAIIKIHIHGGLMGPNSFAFPLTCFAIALMLVFTGCGWLGLDDLAGSGRVGRGKVAAR